MRKTAQGSCLLHQVKPEEVEKLEEIFTKLTPRGWEIPEREISEGLKALKGNNEHDHCGT